MKKLSLAVETTNDFFRILLQNGVRVTIGTEQNKRKYGEHPTRKDEECEVCRT
jgi:hypothetical protein